MNEVPPLRKYYIHDGEQQTGPFSPEELEQMPLTSTTMVWYKGLTDWQEAASIEELLPIINHTVLPHAVEEDVLPPPFKGVRKAEKPEKVPVFRAAQSRAATPDKVVEDLPRRHKSSSGVLKFLVAFVLLGLLGATIYNVQKYRSNRIAIDEAVVEEPTYEEQVLSIEDQEKAVPRKFLKAAGTYKEMVFTGKFKIDGTIANTATVAKFKNVIIEVSFYTSKNKYISAERFTIGDNFPAGSTKEFKLKLDPPKGADNCKWKAVGATPY